MGIFRSSFFLVFCPINTRCVRVFVWIIRKGAGFYHGFFLLASSFFIRSNCLAKSKRCLLFILGHKIAILKIEFVFNLIVYVYRDRLIANRYDTKATIFKAIDCLAFDWQSRAAEKLVQIFKLKTCLFTSSPKYSKALVESFSKKKFFVMQGFACTWIDFFHSSLCPLISRF